MIFTIYAQVVRKIFALSFSKTRAKTFFLRFANIIAQIRYIYSMESAFRSAIKKDALKVCIVGFVFACVLGALSHFFYEWSGENIVAGVFFAANESVWEHMKLVFFPFLVYFAIALPLAPRLYNRVFGAFVATFLAAALIPAVFYTYTAFTGKSVLAVDIATFVVAVLAGFVAAYKIFTTESRYAAALCAIGTVGIAAIAVCYFTLTLFAPDFALFIDPRDGTSGL